jgi:hypothetical protein
MGRLVEMFKNVIAFKNIGTYYNNYIIIFETFK